MGRRGGWSSRFDGYAWLKRLVPEDLHSDYHWIMRERLSLDVLEATWGASLDGRDRSLLDGPALRDRKHKIPELAARLLERLSRETGKQVTGFSSIAMERMMKHPWNNPVELESVVMRAAEVCQEGLVEADDLDIPEFPTSSPRA